MKNNGKQIEEITKDLKENLRLCGGVKLLDHNVETIAYELSKKYQPKLSKDSVILTNNKYERIQLAMILLEQLKKDNAVLESENTSLKKNLKKQARKIFEEIEEFMVDTTLYKNAMKSILSSKFDELKKKYTEGENKR